jgi:hypothetical protein
MKFSTKDVEQIRRFELRQNGKLIENLKLEEKKNVGLITFLSRCLTSTVT